jgi:uncharacterized membrane protein YjjP (DUF1212 family)
MDKCLNTLLVTSYLSSGIILKRCGLEVALANGFLCAGFGALLAGSLATLLQTFCLGCTVDIVMSILSNNVQTCRTASA